MIRRMRASSGWLGPIVVAHLLVAPAPAGNAAGGACTPESFGAAVDEAAAALRNFNAEAQPKLKKKLKSLKDKKGWSEANYEETALAALRDERIAAFDTQSSELFTKIDSLGRPEPEAATSCASLAELKAAGVELLALMKTKSAYLDQKIDKELGLSPAEKPAETPEVAAPTELGPPADAAPPPKGTRQSPRKDAAEPSAGWDATTALAPPAGTLPPEEPPGPPPGELAGGEDGYTIDEIREATRGFFGTISTNLASVLEHAFRKSGRPTAYVLGKEAGGALLAGVRYGSGTLYLRSGGTEKVYWHGPSLGSDLGAEGSRTLFLIYRLADPKGLYRSFTGIDGTAYFVGGVGITFLKGGEVIMAPIRSGIGLRLGASLGYVRFTPHPTWNPF